MKRRIPLTFSLISAAALLVHGAQRKVRVFGDPHVSQWAPSRTYHVENYKLTLRFDEPKGEVFGNEVVTLRPFEGGFRSFYLDSAELKIDSVSLEPPNGTPAKLGFKVQDPRLWIWLDRDHPAKLPLNVRIIYHGFPRTGLFFVNPTAQYPNWPREVYSQGETEFNEYWFPCWDYPNDLASSETITTVPDGQSVVSNGKLARVTHARGNVTYDWVESVPHSSYLISIAVGPWRRIADHYDGKPVDYYVARSVDEAAARRSFHLTPDMIRFFSDATGVEYPYEQYAQTTVANYMFGGQENVSATTLTDGTLHDERADQDYPSTALVSHELGQHWFGDYVQGRDWANIWLNEGFATYMEALYAQHHEGNDSYRFGVYKDQLAAQDQDRDYRRPIVDRHYTDPLSMFDAITHEKGAAVLDMLRYLIDGSDAASRPASQNEPLFRALHQYLTAHRAQTADTDDLVKAIRRTTGQELGWFFHEWVFMAGNPEYHLEANYDRATKIEKVVVTQTQEGEDVPSVFEMAIELAFYGSAGERKKLRIFDNEKRQEFDLPLEFEPQWVDFDPEDFIDKTVQFAEPVEALIAQVAEDPSMMSRLWAAQQLGTAQTEQDARVAALGHALVTDPFYGVRAAAAASLRNMGTERAKAALLAALKQPDSRVRVATVKALGKFSNDPTVRGAFIDALGNDASYAVEAAAAEELGRSGAPDAFQVLQTQVATKSEIHVLTGVLNGLAAIGDARALSILLSEAQPGAPEPIRLNALAALSKLKRTVAQDQRDRLLETVRVALHDPFYLTREMGEKLAAVFGLTECEPDIEAEARTAPMMMQRAAAQQVLDELRSNR